MKKLLALGGIVASIVMIAFGGPVRDSVSQEQIAVSVTPPVPVDNSFMIPVEGDPGDWW